MIDRTREKEVWSRVMSASAGAPMPPQQAVTRSSGLTEDRLRQFLADEAEDAHTYRTLAARTQGNARRTLEQLSQEEQGHYRKLGAVGYLLLGRKLTADRPEAARIDNVPEALRSQYRQELEGAARYRDAAKLAGDYEPLFLELAEDETRHSQTILRLLAELL